MNHFAPHPSAVFEGYYSKFDLPSGAHLALIICTVPRAKKRPHMVSFTYIQPSDASGSPKVLFQRELWADNLEFTTTGPDNQFELRAPGIGYLKVGPDSASTYDLSHDDFRLQAETKSRTPWSPSKSTPEGWLVWLPLPLHWHVHSLSSQCSFNLDIPSLKPEQLPQRVRQALAKVHQEKNWAQSFPKAHIWIQARKSRSDGSESGICIAGGKTLGMTAYLLGYRSKDIELDFTPPFALSFLGISPFMGVDVSWEDRRFELSVQDLWHKTVVRARAPKGTFFSLSSPFPEGHRENYLGQSFEAVVEVEVWRRSGWFGGWEAMGKEVFEGASLEFGGEYYGEAGTDKKRN